MSKAKVEEYKNYKKNKKKILAKEKRKKVASAIILRLVGVLIVAGILFLVCVKGIDMYKSYRASLPDYSTTTYIVGDLCGLKEEAHNHGEETEAESQTSAEETTAEVTTEAVTEAATEVTETTEATEAK